MPTHGFHTDEEVANLLFRGDGSPADYYFNNLESGANGLTLGGGAIVTMTTPAAHSGTQALYRSGGAADTLTFSGLRANTTYGFGCYVYGTANIVSIGAATNFHLTTASPAAWAATAGTFTTDASGDPVTISFDGAAVYYDDLLMCYPLSAADATNQYNVYGSGPDSVPARCRNT